MIFDFLKKNKRVFKNRIIFTLKMIFHLPETKQYLIHLLREIDSPAQTSGDLHLGKCLEEEELIYYHPTDPSAVFVSPFPSIKPLIRALREYLSFDQYLPLDHPWLQRDGPGEVLEEYLKHNYWEINSQSDEESSRHRKAMRSIGKIIPNHICQTLITIDDIKNGACRQNLEGLRAFFYGGTKGYAIEFSILPEDCTNLKVGETKERTNGGIKMTRTDVMTLILSYVRR